MQTKKTPTKLWGMAGDVKRQGRHSTVNHRKNAAVHHHAGATLRTSPKGMVRKNTLKPAVHFPTVSGILLCPNSGAGRGVSTSVRNGLGRGAVFRKAIGVTGFTFLTPRHRLRVRTCPVVNSVQPGTKMKPTTTGQTAPTQNPDYIAITQHATERLALALFELRNGKSTTSLQRATGLVYSAGRALSQVCGGAHHV